MTSGSRSLPPLVPRIAARLGSIAAVLVGLAWSGPVHAQDAPAPAPAPPPAATAVEAPKGTVGGQAAASTGATNLDESKFATTAAPTPDVTHATDYPGADKWRNGDIKMAAGPVLGRGSSTNAVVYRALNDYAAEAGLPVQRQGNPRNSGTDADAMIKTGPGTATGIVSIPNRYMHSPNETVSLTDLDTAATLIAGFIRSLAADFDFRP